MVLIYSKNLHAVITESHLRPFPYTTNQTFQWQIYLVMNVARSWRGACYNVKLSHLVPVKILGAWEHNIIYFVNC